MGRLRRNFSQCRSNFAQATGEDAAYLSLDSVYPNRSEAFGSSIGREARTSERLKQET
jgi:hypothetical protein